MFRLVRSRYDPFNLGGSIAAPLEGMMIVGICIGFMVGFVLCRVLVVVEERE